jgi:hypothetical protein
MVGNDEAGSLEALLDDGWRLHEKESSRLARQLEARPPRG